MLKSMQASLECVEIHSYVFFPCRDKMFPALGFGAQLPPDWKVMCSSDPCA